MTTTLDRRPVVRARVDLAALANLPKGATLKLGGIEARLTTERAYERVLRAMLRDMATVTRTEVLPSYTQRSSLTRDAALTDDIAGWFAGFVVLRNRAIARAEREVRRIIEAEAERHGRRWTALIKAQVNVDLSAIVRAEDLGEYLQAVALRSAGLITALYDDAVRAVTRLTTSAVLEGKSTNDLRKDIQAALGVSSRRAKLIAVNEVGTLVSELSKVRQEQAGVTSYEWSSARDERVRDLHAKYDGQTYRWDKPPADGHPGTAIRCRCVALAILES